MTIKLLALDLDGTIVNRNLQISEAVLKTLKHVMQHTDVRVVIATGRMHQSALPFAQWVGTVEPVVSYQGAMIRSQSNGHVEELLHHAPIDVTDACAVIEWLVQEAFHTNLYIDDQLFTNRDNLYTAQYAKLSGVTPTVLEDLLSHLKEANQPPTKIVAIDDVRVCGLSTRLQEVFPGRLNYCQSRSNFCEVVSRQASKWDALQVLANRWGIQPHEIMACGDEENDLSMLSQAGIGVAMGNAPDHVKAKAKAVTGTIEEDGVVQAVEQFILSDKNDPKETPCDITCV